MKLGRSILFISFLLVFFAHADDISFSNDPKKNLDSKLLPLQKMLKQKDFLGARLYLRLLKKRTLTAFEWYKVREIIYGNSQMGNDVILSWDQKRQEILRDSFHANLDDQIKDADKLLLSGRNQEAFENFQKIALWLKRRAKSVKLSQAQIRFFYPYVIHSMARALFGAGRYDDALEVYTWIPQDYLKFRQILFEKMWSAFRAGRIDLTLGAIASQRSGFFSKYLEPETYLVQIYLYKMLCRNDDLKQVLNEISDFLDKLTKGVYDYQVWAQSDHETRVLLSMALETRLQNIEPISIEMRQNEREYIKKILLERFLYHKKRLLQELPLVQAYSQLASSGSTADVLKPIEKLPSRNALFKANLEIWPGDAAEDWADEIGLHRFIGESHCDDKK